MSASAWVKFGLMSLIWGSTYLWTKLAVQEIGPFTLVSFRTLLAIICLALVLWQQRTPIKFRRRWPIYLFLGTVTMGLPFVLAAWAGTVIPSSLSAILNSTNPFWTVLIASFFLPEERLTINRLVGLALGFTGVVVLMSDRLMVGVGNFQLGMLAMLFAAVCYAVSAVVVRLKTRGIPPTALTIGELIFAWLLVTPGAFIFEAPVRLPAQAVTWAAVFFLGIMASGLSLVLYFSLLHEIGATRTATASYLQPLIGVALGAVFLAEQLDWRMLAGGVMILAGVWWVNKRKK